MQHVCLTSSWPMLMWQQEWLLNLLNAVHKGHYQYICLACACPNLALTALLTVQEWLLKLIDAVYKGHNSCV